MRHTPLRHALLRHALLRHALLHHPWSQRFNRAVTGAVSLGLALLPQVGLAQPATPDPSIEAVPIPPTFQSAPANPPPTTLDLNLDLQPDRPISDPSSPGAIESSIPVSNYLLGVGDGLAISVIGYPEFTSQQVILPDGTISLPLLGSIPVQGQTLEELQQTLTADLQVFLVNPVVSLSLSTQRPLLVTVTGEVQRPGPLALSTGGLPLSQALIQAGGVRRNANISRITIRRPLPQGQEQLQVVDLWQTIQAEISGQSVLLRDGDMVFVPRLTEEEALDRRLIARSSLAPPEIRVRFLGEVVNQGEIALSPHLTLSEALAMAGGPTPASRSGHVTLLRRQDDGTVEERKVDLKDYRNTEQVQDGDIIIVSKRLMPRILDWTQRVTNALNAPLGLVDVINQLLGND